MAPIKDLNTQKSYNKSPQDLQTLKLFVVLFFLTLVLFAGVQAFINFQGLKARQPSTVNESNSNSNGVEVVQPIPEFGDK